MNEPDLKDAAFALAAATPRWLDQPTTPPIHWREDAGQLRVLMADGRTVRGPLPEKKKKAAAVIGLPKHPIPKVKEAMDYLKPPKKETTK